MTKVIATQRGYYGGCIQEEGSTFEFTPAKRPEGHKGEWKGDKVASWMSPVAKKAPEPEEVPSVALEDSYHTSHKGGGYWDVFAPGGKIVEGGDSLRKADAEALVVELTNEAAEE